MRNLLRNACYGTWTVAAILVIAHQLNSPAEAVGQSSGRIIAYAGRTALTDDGNMFYLDSDNWQPNCQSGTGPNALPIPASEVAFLGQGGSTFIDVQGNGWGFYSHCGVGHWTNLGPPPGYGPISVEPSTWSQVKAKDWKPGN